MEKKRVNLTEIKILRDYIVKMFTNPLLPHVNIYKYIQTAHSTHTPALVQITLRFSKKYTFCLEEMKNLLIIIVVSPYDRVMQKCT